MKEKLFIFLLLFFVLSCSNIDSEALKDRFPLKEMRLSIEAKKVNVKNVEFIKSLSKKEEKEKGNIEIKEENNRYYLVKDFECSSLTVLIEGELKKGEDFTENPEEVLVKMQISIDKKVITKSLKYSDLQGKNSFELEISAFNY